MIVEIAWTDIHFIGDVDGSGIGFPLLIEQRKAGDKNTILRFHRIVRSSLAFARCGLSFSRRLPGGSGLFSSAGAGCGLSLCWLFGR